MPRSTGRESVELLPTRDIDDVVLRAWQTNAPPRRQELWHSRMRTELNDNVVASLACRENGLLCGTPRCSDPQLRSTFEEVAQLDRALTPDKARPLNPLLPEKPRLRRDLASRL